MSRTTPIPLAVPVVLLTLVASSCTPVGPADPCATTRCPGRSTCVIAGGVASCRCDRGYLGAACDRCDDAIGFHLAADGVTCTDDPCAFSSCDAANHEVCDRGNCVCDPLSGYHLGADGVTCTVDLCDPNPCDATNNEVCVGGLCGCDAANGYHRSADGQTCTDDPCDPNSCGAANHEVCIGGTCQCDLGFHRGGDGLTCTEDLCDPDPCNAANHEICAGGTCSCDEASGYHLGADGVTCSDALCEPNPCSVANHEVCDQGSCSCDAAAGYHLAADGLTCTTDRCNPNPCNGVDEVCTGGLCEAFDADPCDAALAIPQLDPGYARYFHDDVAVFPTETTYRLSFPHDIVTGELILNVMRDEGGQLVEDLVAAGSFPICVPLDGSADGSGYAFLEDGAVSYATSATHTGRLSIVAREGQALIGRFAFDAQQNAGSVVIEVRAGVFSALPR